MPQARSIHIGANLTDPASYGGWESPLAACVNDANDLADFASKQLACTPTRLFDADATRDAVLQSIRSAATSLDDGDFLLITYSGHGALVPDNTNPDEEPEDQTWCLYDGHLLDDELHATWSHFKPGVRVVVLSDSCHSGTVTKGESVDASWQSRELPRKVAIDSYRSSLQFYEDRRAALPNPPLPIEARVLLISGCQDHELSYEHGRNGRMTATVLACCRDAAFSGTYAALHRELVIELSPTQNPNYFVLGANADRFATEQAFVV